jgi:putative multiple sugar transport system ATP-binding protein
MSDVILEMRNITKTFPGVKALDNVSFSVNQGEIHALVGENGAVYTHTVRILGISIFKARNAGFEILANLKK